MKMRCSISDEDSNEINNKFEKELQDHILKTLAEFEKEKINKLNKKIDDLVKEILKDKNDKKLITELNEKIELIRQEISKNKKEFEASNEQEKNKVNNINENIDLLKNQINLITKEFITKESAEVILNKKVNREEMKKANDEINEILNQSLKEKVTRGELKEEQKKFTLILENNKNEMKIMEQKIINISNDLTFLKDMFSLELELSEIISKNKNFVELLIGESQNIKDAIYKLKKEILNPSGIQLKLSKILENEKYIELLNKIIKIVSTEHSEIEIISPKVGEEYDVDKQEIFGKQVPFGNIKEVITNGIVKSGVVRLRAVVKVESDF